MKHEDLWNGFNRTGLYISSTFSLAFSFSKPICDQSWLTYPVARNTNTDNTQNARCQFAEGGGQEKCSEKRKMVCYFPLWVLPLRYFEWIYTTIKSWFRALRAREKKDGCGMLGLCILTSESPFEKLFQSHRTAKHSKKNHIYPHYWRSTLKPPRSKKSKANPIQTASLTSTRFVSMAVFHSYTSKEKGLQFMWHPNPGLSLSIRALCKRRVPAKTTQLDCYEQFVAWACDLIAPRGYLLMFLI